MTRQKKERIAAGILSGLSYTEICKNEKISESTLHRLKKDEEFNEILNDSRVAAFDEAIDVAHAAVKGCMQSLLEMVNDKTVTASARVNAAKAIIDICERFKEDISVYQRLDYLESLVTDQVL